MLAVAGQGGRIRPQVAVVKALASALCIGGGGSVGREGPIVQIGSALGSTLGQAVRMPEARLRLLVACGAAGGIAATFNAPIAGVFFAMELILRDFAAESFGVVVLASVTACVIGRAALGDQPFLALPAFHVAHPAGVPAATRCSACSPRLVGRRPSPGVLYAVEDLCDWVWRGPEWLRPGRGRRRCSGCCCSRSRRCTASATRCCRTASAGQYALGFLLVLLVGKIVATSLTIGIGGSGGVFAPSLFIGAMLGTGVRRRRAQLSARPSTAPAGRLRARRDGRGVRRRGPRTDHRGDHHVRADRRVLDHPAADARDRDRHRDQHTSGRRTPSTPSSCAAAASTSCVAALPT